MAAVMLLDWKLEHAREEGLLTSNLSEFFRWRAYAAMNAEGATSRTVMPRGASSAMIH